MSRAKLIVTIFATALSLQLNAETIVVPAGMADVEGPEGITTPFRSGGRTMQMVYEAADLAAMPVGSVITGLTFRLDASADTFPASDITFANYDIWLEWPQNRAPGQSLSTTFASNMTANAIMVRSGPLTIPAGSFPGGASPNPFGYIIPFTSPTTNQGGDLIVTLRHSGSGAPDVIIDRTSMTTGVFSGSGTSYTATTMVSDQNGGPIVLQLVYTAPIITNLPPVIHCPQPLVLSTDSGSNVASNVTWNVNVENGDGVLVACLPPNGSTFPLGTNVVTCTASNSAGVAVCQFAVVVEDQEAPVITEIVATADTLWPPNHKMVTVELQVIGDDNSGEVEAEIVEVIPLVKPHKQGELSYEITGPLTVKLEASKSRSHDGVAYKIIVRAVDSSGNTTDETIVIRVAKNKQHASRKQDRHAHNRWRDCRKECADS